MNIELTTAAGLWLAVIASGLYHGVNPGMGWPLAVSAGLMGNGRRDLLKSLAPLSFGHLLAMLSILLPFALLSGLLAWEREIRVGAGLLVVGVGLFLLMRRRHPRALARIPPRRLALWSFAIATAHGAGLMLAPIYLGICSLKDAGAGHSAISGLMGANIWSAALVSLAHTLAMVAGGGAMALVAHEWLGLKFLSRAWFNLDAVWAISLMLVGAISLAMAVGGGA